MNIILPLYERCQTRFECLDKGRSWMLTPSALREADYGSGPASLLNYFPWATGSRPISLGFLLTSSIGKNECFRLNGCKLRIGTSRNLQLRMRRPPAGPGVSYSHLTFYAFNEKSDAPVGI